MKYLGALRNYIVIFSGFAAYFLIADVWFGTIRRWIDSGLSQIGFSHILTYVIVGVPVFFSLYLIHGFKNITNAIGFDKSVLIAFAFSLLCTLPMLIGYAIVFDFNHGFSLNQFLVTVLAAAFFEEMYYRGFLFGQLFRYTSFGFIPSVLIGALVFGAVHIYQGHDVMESIGVFAITFMGAVLYAWVYVEWNYNLCVPIFLHLFMNLFWALFSAAENAMGGFYANLFRSITIALIIILTLTFKRRSHKALSINKANLLINSPQK